MIVCPNCNHQNPDEAVHCEACYTPLPSMTHCPNCDASVQSDASFCGQCGFNLQTTPTHVHAHGEVQPTPLPPTIAFQIEMPIEGESGVPASPLPPTVAVPVGTSVGSEEPGMPVSPLPPTIAAPIPSSEIASPNFDMPDMPFPEPLVKPDPLIVSVPTNPIFETDPPFGNTGNADPSQPPVPVSTPPIPVSMPPEPISPPPIPEAPDSASLTPPPLTPLPLTPPPISAPTVAQTPPRSSAPAAFTQLQTQVARLLHVQTNTMLELPANLTVIHLGKPNDRVPPDVDVSGFPNSEIVSRIHADIRVEGDIYYIEDVGSSNGTYINNAPLPSGNRHRLRPGDRIALGKGDKVTFLFQIS
ncbi:MAG: FHA domain-containing protein [Cyanobacteria bacterium CRU_2_1]|nr:FHA domain-containing protein [Cyanobacteria bacterium CRU_2_1]